MLQCCRCKLNIMKDNISQCLKKLILSVNIKADMQMTSLACVFLNLMQRSIVLPRKTSENLKQSNDITAVQCWSQILTYL